MRKIKNGLLGLLLKWSFAFKWRFESLEVGAHDNRELKIETFSGRRQLQPDVTSSFVGYCAC